MFRHPLAVITITLASFLAGVLAVQITTVSPVNTVAEFEPIALVDPSGTPAQPPANLPFVLPQDNCGPWSDELFLKPIISRWLRNDEIKEVPYCSSTAIEARAYNSTNVLPKLIDVNDDGIDELAVRYGCSPTGNCSMNIYQRVGRSYRRIFADRQSVKYFDKLSTKQAGFRDIQTRSHGSCCDGDQVHYRFTGKTYQPVSCAAYSYWDPTNSGEKEEKPTVTASPCSEALDPR